GAGFIQFHGRGDGGAEGDGIDAVLVAEEIGVSQRVQIIDAGVVAQGPGRLVFQAAGGAPVFGTVDHGVVVLVDDGDAAAGDGAAETGGVGDKIGLPVALAYLVHRLARDLACALELHLAHV